MVIENLFRMATNLKERICDIVKIKQLTFVVFPMIFNTETMALIRGRKAIK